MAPLTPTLGNQCPLLAIEDNRPAGIQHMYVCKYVTTGRQNANTYKIKTFLEVDKPDFYQNLKCLLL